MHLGVEHQIGHLPAVHLFGGVATATQSHLHPGHELFEGERLHHIVVAARGQATDPVTGGAASGQEDHRGPAAGGAEPPQHLVAVEVGQLDVEHHDLGVERGGGGKSLPTGFRGLDLATLQAQRRPDQEGDVGLVVDHKNSGG